MKEREEERERQSTRGVGGIEWQRRERETWATQSSGHQNSIQVSHTDVSAKSIMLDNSLFPFMKHF